MSTKVIFISLGIFFNAGLLSFAAVRLKVSKGSWNQALSRLLVMAVSFLIVLAVFEYVILKLDFMIEKFGNYKYVLLNQRIMDKARKESADNPYGFRVNIGEEGKKKGTKRIVVMGDSFVWGHGLSNPQNIWSRKLAGLVKTEKSRTVVTDFGKVGWSTLDQFEFLKKNGVKYEPDLIIWGFIPNDIIPDKRPRLFSMPLISKMTDILSPYLRIFPATRYFIVHKIDRLLYGTSDHFQSPEYVRKIKRLYNRKNLKRYSLLIKEISRFLKKRNIPCFFVFLPYNPTGFFPAIFGQVKPILQSHEIPFLDLCPKIKEKFGRVPYKKWSLELAANPADGHPGKKLTEVYAQEVFAYLKKNYPKYLFY